MELRDLFREVRGLTPGTLARANVAFFLEEGRLKHETGKFTVNSTRLVEVSEAEEMIGADFWHRPVYPVERRDRKPGKISVGRKTGCDVLIELSSVSSTHASILSPAKGQWTLCDEGSSNGTFVDGTRLEKGGSAELKVGSLVSFGGEVKLMFLDGAAMERVLQQLDPVLQRIAAGSETPPPAAAAPIMPAGTKTRAFSVTGTAKFMAVPTALVSAEFVAAAAAPGRIAPGRGGAAAASLLRLRRPSATAAAVEAPLAITCSPFPPVGLVTGVPVLVGRAVGNDLILPHPNVSRRHACFLRRGSMVTVEDLGSGNGVHVDKRPIDKKAIIKPGAEIGVGPYKILLVETNAVAPRADENLSTRLEM